MQEQNANKQTLQRCQLSSSHDLIFYQCFFPVMQGDTGFVCPPVIDGFYGDPIYCQRFYRCVGDKKYSFTCPSGTFFDNGRFICNFKEKVSECTSSGLRISQAGNGTMSKVLLSSTGYRYTYLVTIIHTFTLILLGAVV